MPHATTVAPPAVCLNCGAALHGAFCGGCGQRVVPAYPSIREMAGDAWEEFSGYDGRLFRTFRMLLRRPGMLTLEVLEGRRARYVSPVRLYLATSLLYFIVAAAAPSLRSPQAVIIPGSNVSIDLMAPSGTGFAGLSPADQARVLAQVDRAPWGLREVLRSALLHPEDLRTRFLQRLPRVLFVLVPIFAALTALFYRAPALQHLVFGLHLHTAVFLALAVQKTANFTGLRGASSAAAVAAMLFITGYALAAFHRTYGGTWPATVVKSLGITLLYAVVGLMALFATFAWAALVN